MNKCSAGKQGDIPDRVRAGRSETAKFVLGVLRRSLWLKCEVWGGDKGVRMRPEKETGVKSRKKI